MKLFSFLLAVFLLSYSCKQSQKMQFSITITSSYKYDLNDGKGRVNSWKKSQDFKFIVPHQDITKLSELYIKNKLYNLPDSVYLQSVNKKVCFPQNGMTIYIVNGNQKKLISYIGAGSCYEDFFNGIPDPKVKPFLEEAKKITDKIRDSLKLKTIYKEYAL